MKTDNSSVLYDLVVVGAGPAGLTAAIYARRAGLRVMILEKETFGGQITHSPKVENYPGFGAVSGNELAEKFVDQALNLGAELDVDIVTDVVRGSDGIFQLTTERGGYQSRSVIVASGAKPRTLGQPNEEELTGNGVSYCVLCDGAFYKNRDVAVIGGGNSALQDAVLLSETSSHVTVVQNLAFLTGEKKLEEILRNKANVSMIFNSVVDSLEATKGELSALMLKNEQTGEVSRLVVDGVFVAIGQVPDNRAFAKVCTIDERGYIVAGESCETGTPGLFAAGDCRTKNIRQITTATGDGAVAALAACRYLNS